MLTDREFLELAAKAAGKEPSDIDGVIYAGFGSREWNPKDHDGDSLRLAVTLGIFLRDDFLKVLSDQLNGGKDRYAATRMAILIIAARIGKLK